MAHAAVRANSQTIALLAGLVACTLAAGAADEPASAARQADFREFAQDFVDNYAYLDRGEKPWLTWPERYAAAVNAASSAESFAAVIEAAFDELHDFHAEVRSRNRHRWLPPILVAEPAGGTDDPVLARGMAELTRMLQVAGPSR